MPRAVPTSDRCSPDRASPSFRVVVLFVLYRDVNRRHRRRRPASLSFHRRRFERCPPRLSFLSIASVASTRHAKSTDFSPMSSFSSRFEDHNLEPPSESIFKSSKSAFICAMSFLRRRRRSSLERKKERKKERREDFSKVKEHCGSIVCRYFLSFDVRSLSHTHTKKTKNKKKQFDTLNSSDTEHTFYKIQKKQKKKKTRHHHHHHQKD